MSTPVGAFLRLRAWWAVNRPLVWIDRLVPDYVAWAPDPPVIERLVR